jgi:hypothetical protein
MGIGNIYSTSRAMMTIFVYDGGGKLLNKFYIPAGERYEYKESDKNGFRTLKWMTKNNVCAFRVVKLQ